MHDIIPTEDGSVTLYVPELKEHYHSVHGAIQEARHIFIRAGIEYYLANRPGCFTEGQPLHILEAGFGTGLNAYLSMLYAEKSQLPICYHSIEKYPLQTKEIDLLNYPQLLGIENSSLFLNLHKIQWDQEIELTPYFRLCKHLDDFRNLDSPTEYDIVFFDAFNPDVQPHLWTRDVFSRFYEALIPNGILVTYCVKGIVKQALRSVGFSIKRLPGPPGKREMLRAEKV